MTQILHQSSIIIEHLKNNNMWIETSNEVYAVIFAKHKKELAPHSSYTDIDGVQELSFGRPAIITEWGFRNSENPLLKIVQTKESQSQQEWDFEFYIYCS